MVNDDVKGDLRELKAFLGGEYKATGHPYDTDTEVIGLDMAIDNLVEGEQAQWAVSSIKSAVREGSWFRIVLREHLDNALFQRAIDLCESISKKLLLVTGDAYAASMPLGGEWQEFEDPVDVWGDPLFHELDDYTQLRCKLSQYTSFC
jgi:hypothetical protein